MFYAGAAISGVASALQGYEAHQKYAKVCKERGVNPSPIYFPKYESTQHAENDDTTSLVAFAFFLGMVC